jgi:hypothetical protein
MGKNTKSLSPNELHEKIEGLKSLLIIERGPFQVFVGKANEIGEILNEIGRQRERTFRAVGEGTGKEIDTDKYDKYYLNLFVYDKVNRCLVGGYRIGQGKEIYEKFGSRGFYIRSLFKIKKPFKSILAQCLELGRSYVVPEYQKTPLPLFILWQGLLKIIQNQEDVRYILGPVSISKEYPESSRSAIVSFVMRHLWDHENAEFIKAKKPYKIQLDWEKIDQIMRLDKDFTDLEDFLKSMEPDHLRLPVLLKQYAKQNAKFLGFNLDPKFNDALDGLMMLDIQNLPEETIEMLLEKRPQDAKKAS